MKIANKLFFLLILTLSAAFNIANASDKSQNISAPQMPEIQARDLAASCVACHSLEPPIKNEERLLKRLLEFRAKDADSAGADSVMAQLTKGYTPEQLAAIAHYFSK